VWTRSQNFSKARTYILATDYQLTEIVELGLPGRIAEGLLLQKENIAIEVHRSGENTHRELGFVYTKTK
jgi:hypothetical protein